MYGSLKGDFMKKYLFFICLLTLSILTAFVGSVFATTKLSGTEKVIITSDPVSRNCQWKGKVSVVDESRSMRPDQHSTLKEDEFNRLKKQARQLGANTIVLSPSSGMTDKKHWAGKDRHNTAASHIYTGNAYRCPAI